MATRAYVGGIGYEHEDMAERVAGRLRKLNEGLDVQVITTESAGSIAGHLKDPAWIKAFLWELTPPDVDTVIWFDDDLIPLRPLGDVVQVASLVPFAAVPYRNGEVDYYLKKYFEPLSWGWPYFNSGFFVASRVTQPAFRLLQSFMQNITRRDWPRYEQSWLNMAVWACFRNYEKLAGGYNWSLPAHDWQDPPDDVVTVHLPGLRAPKRRQKLNEWWKRLA